jgi:AraC-like DNA-binding protein
MINESSLSERLEKEDPLLWHQERSILETTDLICNLMERDGVSRSELARRLKKTAGYVTQLLDGTANMTIRTISDVFFVLGYEFHPHSTKSTTTRVRRKQSAGISRRRMKHRARLRPGS